jgi:CMP-N-acetylneuraminic acid synthetase
MRVLGVIPARGGSKGVKKKNIRLLDGEPLISYTINAAKESKLLTYFIVTSDDEGILKVADSYGSPCHKRDIKNAQDNSPIDAVVFEVLNYLSDKKYDLILLLQPTAPLRTGEDIDNVISMFLEDKLLNNVVSVVEMEDIHPARMYKIDDAHNLMPLEVENEKEQRQNLSSVYLRNGCIYAITTEDFLKNKTLILKEKKAYIMSHDTWANIDTERDLLIAETLIKLWKAKKI